MREASPVVEQAVIASARSLLAASAWVLHLTACMPTEVHHAVHGPRVLSAPEARSDLGMVASGSFEATSAGVEILERGGNAVDAAVAAAFALGSADPGGSGLGGMTYMLVRLADGRAVAIDGTAPVPLAVEPVRLRELRESDRLVGHATAGVPATPAALARALERYGTMRLSQVLEPAIEIAEQGYRLSPHQVTWLDNYRAEILESAYLRFLVLEDGRTIGRVGSRYCNHDLAATLRQIAAHGVESFYRGGIAAAIEVDMRRGGGFVTRSDLALLRVGELEPLRSRYRDVEILSFPSPGGGGALIEALDILEAFPGGLLEGDSPERRHVLVEAFRIARADHARWTPDPNRTVAQSDLPYLDQEFARSRADLITPGHAIEGTLMAASPSFRSVDDNTTHLSVVDRHGNAVALTQTLARQYGGKAAGPGLGFPYNCVLEAYDYDSPTSPAYPRPRRRHCTDMAPTIVLADGEVMAVLGSAGSERIPSSIALVVSNLVDRRMGVRDAVVAPRVLWGGTDPPRPYLEITPPIGEGDADALERAGFGEVYRLRFPPRPIDLTAFGGVNAVARDPDTGAFTGVGDPRRHGFALGPRAIAAPIAGTPEAPR